MGISKSDAWTKLTRNEYYRDIQSMKDRNADGNWDGLERLEKPIFGTSWRQYRMD